MSEKSKNRLPLKLKLIPVVMFAITLVCVGVLLSLPRSPSEHKILIAVRGKVLESTNSTPLPNVNVVAVSDNTYFVKDWTNKTGDFEIWIDHPSNSSIPIFVYASKVGYIERFVNKTLPQELHLIKITSSYSVWGYVDFEPILMVKEGETKT